jgi:hypothetical protein
MGFAQVFYTPWFWTLVAGLLLNSLIVLADHFPGSWRRTQKNKSPLSWQHPLARRVEHSVRLSQFPDDFTGLFQARLSRQGFTLYHSVAEQQRLMAAVRRRWAWLGMIVFYGGLFSLIAAFVLTFFTVKTERFTLSPFQTRSVNLWQGQLALTAVDPERGLSHLTFTPADGGTETLFAWRTYRPTLAHNTLVLPLQGESLLTAEIRDPAGTLLALDPLPENLLPTEHLSMPLAEGGTDDSVYFTVPALDIAMQVSPLPATDAFNVQVRRGDEAVLVDNMLVQPGQTFEIAGNTVLLLRGHSINVVIRQDMGWPFYILALALIVTGGVLTFLRPAVVWLIPEVKGIGGQLYGVMETTGSAQKAAQFLEQLLAIEHSETDENGA